MSDTIICDKSVKAGDALTSPNGTPVIATSNAQDAGGAWMAYVRPITSELELKKLLVANDFGQPWESSLAMIQRLWAAYWKLKQAAAEKKKKQQSSSDAQSKVPSAE